jgi:predicted RNA-binding protein YlxR (DUF448 family)
MTERRCILTGKTDNPDQMVRLAVGPEGQVLPDVRAKAPGRGAWISVTRSALAQAVGNGKLKGALARAFKTGALEIPDDLADRIDAALANQFLNRLGLEAKASAVLTGSEKIDVAARRGQVRLLLHAADAAADGNRKLDQAWRVGQDEEGGNLVGATLPVARGALSAAMGRENVVHIAVTDAGAAKRLQTALDRWQSYSEYANGGHSHGASGPPVASASLGQ